MLVHIQGQAAGIIKRKNCACSPKTNIISSVIFQLLWKDKISQPGLFLLHTQLNTEHPCYSQMSYKHSCCWHIFIKILLFNKHKDIVKCKDRRKRKT